MSGVTTAIADRQTQTTAAVRAGNERAQRHHRLS
jgi:hypothetical protein